MNIVILALVIGGGVLFVTAAMAVAFLESYTKEEDDE